MASGKQHDYDESKIKTLSSLEHIRLRTGMYIGRTGDGLVLGQGEATCRLGWMRGKQVSRACLMAARAVRRRIPSGFGFRISLMASIMDGAYIRMVIPRTTGD